MPPTRYSSHLASQRFDNMPQPASVLRASPRPTKAVRTLELLEEARLLRLKSQALRTELRARVEDAHSTLKQHQENRSQS